MISRERWFSFDKRFQLLTIGAEFERARTAEVAGVGKHEKLALEKAIELIDLTIDDPKWRDDVSKLLGLRAEVARFYVGDRKDSVAILYQAL